MNTLSPDNNTVPRQATFETEPADSVRGRSIRRGEINIPYIDSKEVKNGQAEIDSPKDKDTLKKEHLKALKEKQQKDKDEIATKERELKAKKEKLLKAKNDDLKADKQRELKERELKSLKERDLKADKQRELKERDLKADKQRELKERDLKADKQRELKEKDLKADKQRELKEKELKSLKERDLKADKQRELKERDLKADKQREVKERDLNADKQRELNERGLKADKQRELKERNLKADKQRELNERDLKADKQRELKNLKQKEIKAQNEKNLKGDKGKESNIFQQKDLIAQKEQELKTQREKELKAQREKQLKANNEKEKQRQQHNNQNNQNVSNSKATTYANEKKEVTEGKRPDENPGFFQRLGRSLSPSKNKQIPPANTRDSSIDTKTKSSPGMGDKPVPTLVVGDGRFSEVSESTTGKSGESKEEHETHFKASPRANGRDDMSRSNSDRISADSLTFSNEDTLLSQGSGNKSKPQHNPAKKDAWSTDQNATQPTNNSQKMKVLRKFNSNSPRTSQAEEESTVETAKSKKETYSRSNPPHRAPGTRDDTSSILTDSTENEEPYDQVLAERDCLLTAEVAYKRRIRQLEDETNQLSEALDSRDNEIKELKWNMENPSSVTDVTNLTKKQLEEIEKLKNEVDELKKGMKKYRILHHDSERKVNEIEQENDTLKEKMLLYEQDKLPQMDELQQDNKKLEASFKQMKAKSKEAEEHFEILKSENISLNDEVRTRRNEVQELILNLKDQKAAEVEVEKANTRVEEHLKKISHLEKELAGVVAKTAIMDAEKEHCQSLMKEKENEIQELQDQLESNDNHIENHKLAVELQKEEIDNLKEDVDKQKKEIEKVEKLEQEIKGLKATIKSLQDELDESQKENKLLKDEVDGEKQKIERIQEHVQTEAENTQNLRKMNGNLKAEKKQKHELEEELELSKSEISKLQQQNMELNIKIGNLNERCKYFEDSSSIKEKRRESDPKDKLAEENRRLKIRLVEKNFDELTGNEKCLSSRLENLERKQVDNDVKVRQLQGCVDDIIAEPLVNRHSPAVANASKTPNNVIPRVAVAVQSDKLPRNKNTKAKKRRDISPRLPHGKQPEARVTVSLGDSRSSTPSLPIIQGIPEQAPVYNSYFYLYKQKQKMLKHQQRSR